MQLPVEAAALSMLSTVPVPTGAPLVMVPTLLDPLDVPEPEVPGSS